MQNASTGWVETPTNTERIAVSLVLRDMGNGVTRVLRAACVMGSVPPREFFEVFDVAEVPFPLCERLKDALDCAAALGGYDAGRDYSGGVMRTLTDDITEFFLW